MSLIRTLYLYLFSFVGLIITVIGTIGLLNIALKAFIFTEADRNAYSYPACAPEILEKINFSSTDSQADAATSSDVCLTAQEKKEIGQWVASYKDWKEQNEKIDQVAVQRQREASDNLAMIFIGLPLYIFHWAIIKRELSKEKDAKIS